MAGLAATWNSKPFTTFRYYKNIQDEQVCTKCGKKSQQYFLRYRIYMSHMFPIIPTCSLYYFVCPSCGEIVEIDGNILDSLKQKSKNIKPIRYNKYSQLDLEEPLSDDLLVWGTQKEFKHNVKLHLKDMRQ